MKQYMKILTIVGFLVLAASGELGKSFECPSQFGLFPDPANCIKFYQCAHGNAFRHTCPVGHDGAHLHYDPAGQRCNYAELVDCGSRPLCGAHDELCTDPEDGPSTPAPISVRTCDEVACPWSGALMERSRCDHCYCHCSNYVPIEMCCPAGLVFYQPTKQCEYASTAGCLA